MSTTLRLREHRGGIRRLTPMEIDAIKAAHPIEALAASYDVRLKRLGATLVGLCPLHQETRPSFTIYPEAQRFQCFGCRQGGDVIELVQLLERVGFLEAIELLHGTPTQQHHLVVRSAPVRAAEAATSSYTDQVLAARASPAGQAALDVASWLYHRMLLDAPNAQTYLAQRGVGRDLAQLRGLGYCTGTHLVSALRQQRIPLEVAWAIGLLVGGDGRERFAGRVTIPEVRAGRTIWLTGRLLDETQDAPRYMSLPGPRPLLGAEHITGRDAVVVVEGAFDWLTLVGWGVPGCAALGGSLAQEASILLSRARAIYLAFDRDPPGQRSAQVVAARLGERVRLVSLPDGFKDVNELGQRPDGVARFRACLQQAAQTVRSAGPTPSRDRKPGREAA